MSLRGSEQVTIRFFNSHTFEDNAGNGIVLIPLQGLLSEFKYKDPYWSNVLDGIADYVLIGIAALGFVNFICSSYWGASMTSYWTIFFYLQIITLTPLLSANWPMFVNTFIGKISQYLNFEIPQIPNVIFD